MAGCCRESRDRDHKLSMPERTSCLWFRIINCYCYERNGKRQNWTHRYPGFEDYVNENFLPDSIKLPEGSKNISDSFFRQKLTQYLFSPQGAKFKDWFQFENGDKPVCGEEAPIVKVNSMQSQRIFDWNIKSANDVWKRKEIEVVRSNFWIVGHRLSF